MPASQFNLGWMLQHIRNGFSTHGPFEYRAFIQHVWEELERSGVEGIEKRAVAPGASPFNYFQSDRVLRNLTNEAFLYLFHNGYISTSPEGNEFEPGPFLGKYIITERGRTWFNGKSPLPEHHEGYMTFLRGLLPALDPVIDQYVSEGLIAYGHQAQFASVVMFGAAAEKEVYILAESIRDAFKDPAKHKKMQAALDGRSIKALENEINATLVPLRKSHYKIFEGSDAHLISFFEAIRKQRNDAVHPENASVSDVSVRMLIDAFPNALVKCEEMRRWFLASSKSI
jgi:hypothetical protein